MDINQTRRPRPEGTRRPAPENGAQTRQRRRKASPDSRGKRPGTKQPRSGESARRARQNREAALARQRQQARAKQRKKASRRPAPAVIYTQPAVFNRNRLLMQLLIVTAVVLAVVMGLSIFFKVDVICVYGANVYSAWTVREASGIQTGDNLLTFSVPRACAQIKANLPYVKTARIGIKLPDTVNIIIEEETVVYAVQSSDGLWWLMTSGGKIVEQTDGGTAGSYTKLLGVTLESPVINEQAVAMEAPQEATTQTDASGDVVGTEPVIVTGAQRLQVGLEILQHLESNDVVGEAASVNVAELGDIQLWYGQQYQVKLGDNSNLAYKIAQMCAAIRSSELTTGYGVLDVRYTLWPDQVGYTPFE